MLDRGSPRIYLYLAAFATPYRLHTTPYGDPALPSETAWKYKKLVHQGTGDPLVPFSIWVKLVSLRIAEIDDLFFHHWIEP